MNLKLYHQVPFDIDAFEAVPKSHEPPAYAIIFLETDQTTVHFHDYLDSSVWQTKRRKLDDVEGQSGNNDITR
jgi:hypothetical protein